MDLVQLEQVLGVGSIIVIVSTICIHLFWIKFIKKDDE